MRTDLKLGNIFPDFELPNQDNQTIRLSKFRGQKNVVLYFYPKDFTSGCTKESCQFQSEWKAFEGLNAVVLGVSSDSPSSHAKFRAAHGLKFDLLADEKNEARKLYGAASLGGILPGRVTFVIDKQGNVAHVFSSQTSPLEHVTVARQALEKLR